MNPVLVYDAYCRPPHFTHKSETTDELVARHLVASGMKPEGLSATDSANLFRRDLSLTRDDIHSDLISDGLFEACLRFQDALGAVDVIQAETLPQWGAATKVNGRDSLFVRTKRNQPRAELRVFYRRSSDTARPSSASCLGPLRFLDLKNSASSGCPGQLFELELLGYWMKRFELTPCRNEDEQDSMLRLYETMTGLTVTSVPPVFLAVLRLNLILEVHPNINICGIESLFSMETACLKKRDIYFPGVEYGVRLYYQKSTDSA